MDYKKLNYNKGQFYLSKDGEDIHYFEKNPFGNNPDHYLMVSKYYHQRRVVVSDIFLGELSMTFNKMIEKSGHILLEDSEQINVEFRKKFAPNSEKPSETNSNIWVIS